MTAGKMPKSRRFPSAIFLKIATVFACLVGGGLQAADKYSAIDFLWTVTSSYHRAFEPFEKPLSVEVELGQVIAQSLYLGAVADYWISTRDNSGVAENLKLVNIGLEAGFIKMKYRLFWMLTATAFYPLMFQVDSASDSYVPSQLPFSFRFRLSVGVRLMPYTAMVLGIGYTLQDLGTLASGSNTFPSVTLGGLIISGGLAFTL